MVSVGPVLQVSVALAVLACQTAALVASARKGAQGHLVALFAEEPPAKKKDLVETLFGMIFGEVEDAPMGLSRMSVETFPDQYPADVTGRRPDPVASDDALAAAYGRPVLAQTVLEKRELVLSYDASRDGFTPAAWHAAVDRKGPGLLICQAEDGQIFGGYNSKGWAGFGENRPGLANFLFVWDAEDFTKLRKVGGAGMATVDLPELGPSFGSEGLVIPLREPAPRRARVKLGAYYARMPGTDAKTFLTNAAPAVDLNNIQCYFGKWADDEDVPFDDAIPFSLT